jgi:hypothetical protein
VKVLDFGLAKLTQGDDKVSHKTRTGSVMGTPYYMAPEQCEGKANIDHRADIYSLGVILFEMLTGKVPFGGEGYGEIIVKHITAAVPSPRAINPLLPRLSKASSCARWPSRARIASRPWKNSPRPCSTRKGYAATAPAMAAHPANCRPPPSWTAWGRPEWAADSVVSGQVLFGNSNTEMGARSVPLALHLPARGGRADGRGRRSSPSHQATQDGARRRHRWRRGYRGPGGLLLHAAKLDRARRPDKPRRSCTRGAQEGEVEFQVRSRGRCGSAQGHQRTARHHALRRRAAVFADSHRLLFRKDSFGDKIETFVPAESGQVAVALTATRSRSAAAPAARRSQPENKPAAKPAAAVDTASPRGGRKHGGHAMDEDGVLAPSF